MMKRYRGGSDEWKMTNLPKLDDAVGEEMSKR
jgi:hypothetical protein